MSQADGDQVPGHVLVMLTNAVAPDKLGGLERYVTELSRSLASSGATVAVVSKQVAPTAPTHERVVVGDGALEIYRYRMPSKRNPVFAAVYPFYVFRGVKRALAEIRASAGGKRMVLHAHFPVPAMLLGLVGAEYIYTCHAPVYKELLGERQGSYWLPRPVQSLAVAALKGAERFVLRRASRVVTLSRFIRSEVALLDDVVGRQVTLIPGGLDTDRFSPAGDRDLEPLPGSPAVFTARRLVERTGVELAVESLVSLRKELPDAHLYIAGSGPREGAIRELIDRWGLQRNVTLLGRISEEDLVGCYRRADIALTPTKALEGFGLSTAEALACGTPALVTPIGANPEVVSGLSPLLVADGSSPEEIAEAVVRLWISGEVPRIREQARCSVHPRFSWPAVVERHRALYAEVMRA